MPDATYVALLRGINVTGRNMIPMAELRSLCAGLGWADVQTYIQSGNVIFRSGAGRAALGTALERAISTTFSLDIPVIVRTASSWPAYIRNNPFPDASRTEPNRVMLTLSRETPKPEAATALRERAAHGERIEQVGDAIWIHYAESMARTKLSPSLLDRLVGSPVTARNWRTVLKIQELVQPLGRE